MTYTLVSVAARTAADLVRAATDFAAENGWVVAAAVVDAQGVLLAILRMDGAAPPIADFALDKAYTAATMKRATTAFADRMAGSTSLSLGLASRPRLLTWGGGLPILEDGRVIGGIGVSGARDVDDIACGRFALASVGLETSP